MKQFILIFLFSAFAQIGISFRTKLLSRPWVAAFFYPQNWIFKEGNCFFMPAFGLPLLKYFADATESEYDGWKSMEWKLILFDFRIFNQFISTLEKVLLFYLCFFSTSKLKKVEKKKSEILFVTIISSFFFDNDL